MRKPRIRRPHSLAGRLFAVQIVLVAAVVTGCAVFAYLTDRSQAEAAARRQVTATATAVAASPAVRESIRSTDPTSTLQPYAEQVRRDTDVDFVTIMRPDGSRWTHPDSTRIGERFLGHTRPALDGVTFSETYTGTLGPSVRAVAPVRDTDQPDGRVVALVSAGIKVDSISADVRRQLTGLLGVALAALTLGGIGTYLLNARLRRHTHGMNAAELSRMHDYHQAALHAVREGLLMLDGRRCVALVNDGGRELLGLHGDVVGRRVDALGLPPALTEALLATEPRVDEVHLTADRIVVVNTSPVSGGERRGTVVTLRDHTELQALSGELDSVRGFAEALRSQSHEAANRLHAVVSLIELGRADEAVDFATAELELAQALTDQVMAAVAEPVLAALLLGKAAQANEHGVELLLTPDTRIDDGLLPPALTPRDLVTILGNLIDNALDASASEANRPAARTGPTTLADPAPAPGAHAAAPAPTRPEAGNHDAAQPHHPATAERGGAAPQPEADRPGEAEPVGASDEPAPRPRPTRHTPARHTTAERAAAAPQAGPHPTQPEADRPGAAQPQQAPADAEQVDAAPQPDGHLPRPQADRSGAAQPQQAPADAEHVGAAPQPDGHLPRPEADRSGAAARHAGRGTALLLAPAQGTPHRRPQVTVTVRADGGELLLRVGDTGPGVAAEVVDEVFRRGWSTKSAGPAPHGRGLGLALVRQAARRNGGTVTVGESPAGGAEFTVRLPLLVTASATASATTSASTPGATP
ncbi:ATP-binding protein [Streptomyces syringium]|uniref:ATP-binding protein n=1 Tax=Streptomyces syringium TaxID=76729 RepID=UPI0034490240